ncbi:MAG: hypothetical protein AAF583_03095 [Pseudomonadota bacterium]
MQLDAFPSFKEVVYHIAFAVFVLGIPVAISMRPQAPDINCAKRSDCYLIEGPLDWQHVVEIREVENLNRVVVDSPGGVTLIGTTLGQELLKSDAELIILNRCSSACAEFIMPAARAVFAHNKPRIGVHGNLFFSQQILVEQGIDVPDSCQNKALADIEEIYRVRNLNRDFYWEQRKRLGEMHADFEERENKCPIVHRWEFEVAAWYPTSAQIESMWGLSIDGALCSDDARCVERQIEWPSGERVCVVEDRRVSC